ncbi:encapsulin [Saccharopolyspora mangrovi]|uniref:Family 1 encapsulin nanocompartment shell protein n=1 Tax=Saccharopolyspora mangrovi TaxID=3082379 RepID=A0ABU6AF93_9PSEU|nr:family 1 encapsulin nanocompartment shell protein [Saccharopolyspora sp. S2-29]MEB3370127.1 family 1 encapsulin nanocompartment shell protein [Saccharopolyspora sp. S2-29]
MGSRRPLRLAAQPRRVHDGQRHDRRRRPAIEQLAHVTGGDVLWTTALEGGLLTSTRGGDCDLVLGRDLSIGYLSHDATSIELYLEEVRGTGAHPGVQR